MVHLSEALVDADIPQVSIDEGEPDGNSIVDGIELGEALGGQGFKAQGKAGFRHCGARLDCGRRRFEPFGECFRKLLGWDWAAIEPSLADVAAEPEEHVGDGLVLDAFGDGGETEAVAEADDGGGDLSALAGVSHGADEAGVDLELVEGEELEVAEAGVAGAEVVEREARTLLLELVRDAGGVFGVADEGALGDFEDESLEREVGVLGGGEDVPGEGEVGELGEGDVDGEREVGGDIFGCGEDGAEEFASKEAVEAGLLCEGDELVGQDETALGMLPAGECFEAAEEAGAQFDEGLEVGNDLVVFERAAQIVGVVGSHGWNDTTGLVGLIQ
jgi:hypothetical protein